MKKPYVKNTAVTIKYTFSWQAVLFMTEGKQIQGQYSEKLNNLCTFSGTCKKTISHTVYNRLIHFIT